MKPEPRKIYSKRTPSTEQIIDKSLKNLVNENAPYEYSDSDRETIKRMLKQAKRNIFNSAKAMYI